MNDRDLQRLANLVTVIDHAEIHGRVGDRQQIEWMRDERDELLKKYERKDKR